MNIYTEKLFITDIVIFVTYIIFVQLLPFSIFISLSSVESISPKSIINFLCFGKYLLEKKFMMLLNNTTIIV